MTATRLRADLFRSHLTAFTRLLHKVEDGDVRAIHKTRVATRRLREVVPIMPLAPSASARLLKDLRRATRVLGPIRELDVTAGLLTDLGREVTGAQASLAAVLHDVQKDRAAAYGRAAKKGALGRDLRGLSRRLARVARDLDRSAGADRRRWRWALEARVVRRASALDAAIRRAGPSYVPERLHDVRIALKKLRYALELLAAATGSSARAVPILRRTQALLGALHDRQRLAERVRETQARLQPNDQALSRPLDDLITFLEEDCRTLHARFVRQRSRLLQACDRLTPTRADAAPAPRVAASGTRVRRAG